MQFVHTTSATTHFSTSTYYTPNNIKERRNSHAPTLTRSSLSLSQDLTITDFGS